MARKPARRAVGPATYQRLDQLYAELPPLDCQGLCQASCGPIVMSHAERHRIRERGIRIPLAATCPALTEAGTCAVHDIRPLICRLWGMVEAMACPHGCRPEGGWLDDASAADLIDRSLQLGGKPSASSLSPARLRRLINELATAAPHLPADSPSSPTIHP